MRRAIAARDIRVGDIVEREFLDSTDQVTVIRRGKVTNVIASGATIVLGSKHLAGTDTGEWFLIDRPKPPVELPKREGLCVASWEVAKSFALLSAGGINRLGRWKRINGELRFIPVGSTASIQANRITAITEVTAVPDDALGALAELQRVMTPSDCPDVHSIRVTLDQFFRRVNEVQP